MPDHETLQSLDTTEADGPQMSIDPDLDPTGEAARGQSSELVCEPPPARERFETAVAAGRLMAALEIWAELTDDEKSGFRNDEAMIGGAINGAELANGITFLQGMGVEVFDHYTRLAENLLLESLTGDQCVPEALSIIGDDKDQVAWALPPRTEPQDFAELMEVLQILPRDQLDIIGLFGGELSWDVFIRVVTLFPQADRQLALQEVRAQQRWDELLDNLTDQHMPIVQGWLNEDLGDGTDQTLDERITAALNSARANTAKASLDATIAMDSNGRITPRLRELLILGVALPKLAGQAQAQEGTLSPAQVDRAAWALIWMPQREYLRLTMLLEMTGDQSRLEQSFLTLEATAARAGEFGPFQMMMNAPQSLEGLEDFSDATRNMDVNTLIEQTSVVQTGASAATGMIQKFTDSCGPTSLQVVRAEADPVEALRMRQGGELAQNALDTPAGREQEVALERHAGQTAVPRSSATEIAAITAALPGCGATATQQQAVLDYVNGANFDLLDYAFGVGHLSVSMGGSFPGLDGMRMIREGQAGTGGNAGLFTSEVVQENATMGVDTATGRQMQDNFDNTLWNMWVAAGQTINAANTASWQARVTTLLNSAATLIDQGRDVIFIVYWSGGGGHFMTFTNVRTPATGRDFLIHDPWTGTTQWVTQANILAGNFPGGQALICGLQG